MTDRTHIITANDTACSMCDSLPEATFMGVGLHLLSHKALIGVAKRLMRDADEARGRKEHEFKMLSDLRKMRPR